VGGVFEIFRIRPDGKDPVQLTFGGADSVNPTWSPDGRILAFASRKAGNSNIYLIRSDGTGERSITKSGSNETAPAWSPMIE
jgi:TolB protein